MAITITSPITGTAQTGLTAPTYTVVSDQSPDTNTKQVAVTALGGTQVGVTTHSATNPFSLSVQRPKIFKILGAANPGSGVISNVPVNTFRVVTKKGVTPAAQQAPRLMTIDTSLHIVSGSDSYDPQNVRAAISAHIGLLQQISLGLGDTTVTGIM